MEEIIVQIRPFADSVERLSRRIQSIWNDDLGAPPSFLQNAREQDKLWQEKLMKRMDDLSLKVQESKEEKIHEEGMSRGSAEANKLIEDHKRGLRERLTLLATIVAVIISFIMMVIGVGAYLSSKHIVELPWLPDIRKLMDNRVPTVYAHDKPDSQADTPTLPN